MKYKKTAVVLSVLLSFVLTALSGCVMVSRDILSNEETPSIFLDVLGLKGTNEDGTVGYLDSFTLNISATTLSLITGESAFSVANNKVNMYFLAKKEKLEALTGNKFKYGNESQSSNGQLYYYYNFSVFNPSQADEEPVLRSQNIFNRTYECRRSNPLSDFKSYFEQGGIFSDIDKVFVNYNSGIDTLPVYYYIDCNSNHIRNNGNGTRTIYLDSSEYLTVGYWKSTVANPPQLIWYRSLPVTIGWNIVAIVAGVLVIFILLIIYTNKAKKNRNKTQGERDAE